jgi:hypothetical protein
MKLWNQSHLTAGADPEKRIEATSRRNRLVIVGALVLFAAVLFMIFALPLLLD